MSIYDLGSPQSGLSLNQNRSSFGGMPINADYSFGTGASSGGGITMPANLTSYLGNSRGGVLNGPSDGWADNFFGPGKGLGLNLDTTKLGFGALNSIFNLFATNEARKAIKAQTAMAQRNLENTELAYDTNISNRFRTAAGLYGRNVDDAERTALTKYGTGRLLSRGSLDANKPSTTTAVA